MLALLTTPVAHPVSLAGKPDTEPMVVNYIMEFNTVKPTPEGGLELAGVGDGRGTLRLLSALIGSKRGRRCT